VIGYVVLFYSSGRMDNSTFGNLTFLRLCPFYVSCCFTCNDFIAILWMVLRTEARYSILSTLLVVYQRGEFAARCRAESGMMFWVLASLGLLSLLAACIHRLFRSPHVLKSFLYSLLDTLFALTPKCSNVPYSRVAMALHVPNFIR